MLSLLTPPHSVQHLRGWSGFWTSNYRQWPLFEVKPTWRHWHIHIGISVIRYDPVWGTDMTNSYTLVQIYLVNLFHLTKPLLKYNTTDRCVSFPEILKIFFNTIRCQLLFSTFTRKSPTSHLSSVSIFPQPIIHVLTLFIIHYLLICNTTVLWSNSLVSKAFISWRVKGDIIWLFYWWKI